VTLKIEKSEQAALSVPMGIREASNFLPVLESLRGVAILLVFFFHADGLINPTPFTGILVSPLSAYVHAGHTGVTLFFVLSAFLLSRPYVSKEIGTRRISTAQFFRRRALRILPLYWFAVIASSVVHTVREGGEFATGLPYLFFLNSFPGASQPMFPFSDVWWSLATEAQFYLLLPILGGLARYRAGRYVIVAMGVAYAAGYVIAVSAGLSLKTALALTGRLPAFAIGGAASWVYLRYGDSLKRRLHAAAWLRHGGADLVLFAVLTAMGFLLREVVFRGFYSAETSWHGWHVAEALLWALVVLLVLLAPIRIGVLLSHAWIGVVGRLSYSLYLVHMPILFYSLYPRRGAIPELFQGWNPTSLAAVGVCLAIALALSTITYWAIERPFLRSKSRVST
jgi:peptidoglycan/LPS O-acetylase OafA/YrhL